MKAHFIGIGGIGVSALAQYYLHQGWQVSGSDLQESALTRMLVEKGVAIAVGQANASNVPPDAKLVVFSPAVPPENSELQRARQLQVTSPELKVLSYPQALGQLTGQHFTIAVAGTHGKSTTCAMLANILIAAGYNPTVIVGAKLKEFNNSNFRAGLEPEADKLKLITNNQKLLLIEADEWQASFLNYWPKLILLLNIEPEHLDYFKNLEHILQTYREFVSHLSADGVLVANDDDENVKKIKWPRTVHYSLKQPEASKVKAVLTIPGIHNVANGLAAFTAGRILGAPDGLGFKALSKYEGAWRRLETTRVKFGKKTLTLISDYGHHPTEIRATMAALREKYPRNKLWLIFQPHQYQRTYYLWDDFVKLFKEKRLFDKLTITDIYDVAGREDNRVSEGITARQLVEALGSPQTEYQPFDLNKLSDYIIQNALASQVIVIMGAGNIDDLFRRLTQRA